MTTDIIDQLAGLKPGSPAYATRHQREKAAAATQACYDLFFGPALANSGLSLAERFLVAQDTAERIGLPRAAAHYARLADKQPPVPQSPRREEILRFARALAVNPAQADKAALQALPVAGLSVPDAILLAQLIGFLAYQLRLVAALGALAAAGQGDAPAPASAGNAPFVHPANLPPPGEILNIGGFTNATLGWKAWLPVVDPATASAAQLAVLDSSHPKARTSDFYLVLAHQPEVLADRSTAFNAIMYAPGGLARHERELATVAVSRINRCVYCASVHAQRAAGLSDLELLNALHAAALFAWANRLMLNLGEPVFP